MTKRDYIPGLRLSDGSPKVTDICESASAQTRRLTAIALIRRELPLIEAGDEPILRATALARQLLTVLEIP